MKNFWIEMAQEIGVEFEEEFNYTLDGYCCNAKITENGLLIELNDGFVDIPTPTFINNFIAGVGEIELLPFEPKYHEEYWTICCDSLDIIQDTWSGHYVDYHRKLQRLVFRTCEQAIKAKIEYIEKLKEIGYERG